MIPYGHQDISDADVAAVVAVLRSDYVTQGPAVPRFEASITSCCGAVAGVAVSSGTAALHLACRALGLAEGGLLWTSPITFVATANAARLCGADVDFVDVEEDTANMDVSALEARLERAAARGRLPDVVAPVHLGGASCDMRRIAELAEEYGFSVLEDGCHAIGGSYEGRPVGDCRFSRAAVFSFHPVKTITTGEGGMVVTNDQDLAERVALLRTHGVTRDEGLMEREPDGPWYYEQVDLGLNYRMTDLQAALGESQMARLGEFVSRRRQLATRYDDSFRGLPVAPLVVRPEVESAYHLYVIRVLPGASMSRAELYASLLAAGIGVSVHYLPVHLQPYYRRLGFAVGDFPVAERYASQAITLPLFPSMSDSHQETVVEAVWAAVGRSETRPT